MTYHILADIASDLPKSYAQQYDQLQLLPMPYRMGGVELEYKTGDEENIRDFYRRLREGEQSTTAQITVETYTSAFSELAASGEDGVAVIARHMNYGLYRVEGASDCPRDALNICRMLSLKPEILEKIQQAY